MQQGGFGKAVNHFQKSGMAEAPPHLSSERFAIPTTIIFLYFYTLSLFNVTTYCQFPYNYYLIFIHTLTYLYIRNRDFPSFLYNQNTLIQSKYINPSLVYFFTTKNPYPIIRAKIY